MAKQFVKAGFAAVLLSCSALSASAQLGLESTGLGQTDSWSVGNLSNSQGALAPSMWKGSDTKTLSKLFAKLDKRNLTPASRDMLRRVLLSSSQSPSGDGADALLAERLNMIWALGELENYVEIAGQLPEAPEKTIPPIEAGLEVQFLLGNFASACSTVRTQSDPDAYLFSARAACFALQGDLASAELALELGRDLGIQQPWQISVFATLSEALLEAEADEKTDKKSDKKDTKSEARPPAKFDSGLNAALSLAADLPITSASLTDINPGFAKLISGRNDISRSLRIQTADIAAQAGLMSTDEYLRAYRLEPVPPPPPGSIIIETAETPEDAPVVEKPKPEDDINAPVNALDAALQAASDPTIDEAEHVRLIRRALSEAQADASRFLVTSRALAPDMRDLGDIEALGDNAERFALVALIAGEPALSAKFQGATEIEGGPKPDATMQAWLDGLRIVNGSDSSPASADLVSEKLTVKVATNMRRPTAKMLSLFLTLDKRVSPKARSFIAEMPQDTLTTGRSADRRELMLTEASFSAGSVGEGLMRMIQLIGRDTSALSVVDLSQLVDILKSSGFETEARSLALEGLRLERPMN